MLIDGKYTIPGSSLRGPIRSFYETLTNSCFSTLPDDTRITRREYHTKQNAPQPGLLMRTKDGWNLYKATRYKIPMNYESMIDNIPTDDFLDNLDNKRLFTTDDLKAFKWGEEIDFTVFTVTDGTSEKEYVSCIGKKGSLTENVKNGYLKIGEFFSSKKFESIFKLKDKNNPVCADQKKIKKAYALFRNALDMYQDDAVNKQLSENNHSGYRVYPKELDDNTMVSVIPIWYRREEDRIYLLPANLGRFTFYRSVNDLVSQLGPCSNRKDEESQENEYKVCKACALFGMIAGKGHSRSFGSKVRFSDAHLIGNKKPVPCELVELASPHVSYLPFYAETKDGLFDYDSDKARIRGRKYYWHHEPDPSYYKNTGERNIRNANMELMGGKGDDEARFSFYVWFDDISEEQLNDLVWILCLGENNEESKRCIKIGHGKPFGFGSCKILVKDIKERIFDGENYKEIPRNADEILQIWESDNKQIKRTGRFNELVRIHTFEKNGFDVQYPSVIVEQGVYANANDRASHQWFSENFDLGSKIAKYTLSGIRSACSPSAGIGVSLPRLHLSNVNQPGEAMIYQPPAEEKPAKRGLVKAVWICSAKLSEKAEKDFRALSGFEGQITHINKDLENVNVKDLSKEYDILLAEKPDKRKAGKVQPKLDEAMIHFGDVWTFKTDRKKWEKK